MTGLTSPVLDKGFVRLDEYSPNADLSVVNAARVSFNKHKAEFDEDEDQKLINYLMKHRHGSPFEHNIFRWHVKLPLFVVREWHRHRIGWSYNEWSGRYAKLEPEWYVPERDQVRHQTGRPGAYTFERIEDDTLAESVREGIDLDSGYAFDAYEHMLKSGIAKEQARLVLPVNTYTEMYATCNARSLMHFLGLRSSEHAMYEIRQYAVAMLDIFQEVMPVTAAAFEQNGRVSP